MLFFFFLFFSWLGSVLEHHLINENVFWIKKKNKRVEKKKLEVHVFVHDRCEANLSMGWLVCGCIFKLSHEVMSIDGKKKNSMVQLLFPLLRAIRCPRQETGSGQRKTAD